MVVSLYYYLRVIRAVFMDRNDKPIEKIKPGAPVMFGLLICGAAILLAGLMSWIYDYIHSLS